MKIIKMAKKNKSIFEGLLQNNNRAKRKKFSQSKRKRLKI